MSFLQYADSENERTDTIIRHRMPDINDARVFAASPRPNSTRSVACADQSSATTLPRLLLLLPRWQRSIRVAIETVTSENRLPGFPIGRLTDAARSGGGQAAAETVWCRRPRWLDLGWPVGCLSG